MTQFSNHKDTITPGLMLAAAVGRITLQIARRKEGIRLTQKEEELLAKDMGQCLYYLSSLCDQVPVSMQRIAEIILADVESAAIKRLQGGQNQSTR